MLAWPSLPAGSCGSGTHHGGVSKNSRTVMASDSVATMFRGLALAILILEGTAWADDPLAQARKAVAESDYVAARGQLAAALDAGGKTPEQLVELYRLSGIVDAALGDARAATDAFTHLLALSPSAALPDGTSPKIRRPFDAASRYFTSHAALELKLETLATPPTITLVLVSDPLAMVAKVHVVYTVDGGAEQAKDVVASERTEVTLPQARRIDARVSALDAHGNHLVEIGSKEVPVVIIGPAPPPGPVAAPVVRPAPVAVSAAAQPIYLVWWPYAAGSAVFAGAAGYFAWSARSAAGDLDRLNADSVHHQFAEAKAVQDRGRRDVIVANIGLGLAGGLAIAAGVVYLVTPHARVETRVTAIPVPGGGAVVLGGDF